MSVLIHMNLSKSLYIIFRYKINFVVPITRCIMIFSTLYQISITILLWHDRKFLSYFRFNGI